MAAVAADCSNSITADGYKDAAEKWAAAIKKRAKTDAIVSGILAAAQLALSISIANAQKALADRRVRLAEAVLAHAKEFWPYEKALVDEAAGEPVHEPQYASLSPAFMHLAGKSMEAGKKSWKSRLHRMCVATSSCSRSRWDRAAGMAKADTMSFGDRVAETRAEALNDIRFSHRYTSLGLGRGILNNIVDYADIAAAAGMSVGQALASTINSGLEAYGYYQTRRSAGESGWGAAARANVQAMPYSPQAIAAPEREVVLTQSDQKWYSGSWNPFEGR